MLVKINDNIALEMLMHRVKEWTQNENVIKLYEIMYADEIEAGCFDGDVFNVNDIVDNDYVNWCSVISKGDRAYEGIKKLWEENSSRDISCEDEYNDGYSFIEAEYNGIFLVRS